MSTDILLLHGFASTGESYFLPSLRERYKAEHTVHAPSFPSPNEPHIDAWTSVYESLPTKSFKAVIAHSLGGSFALSLLSRGLLDCESLMMIGSSPGPKEHAGMNTFLKYPVDFDTIRTRAGEIVTVQSLDDPWTFPEYGLVMIRHTRSYGMVFADQGHFEKDHLPESVLSTLDRMVISE